VSALVPPQPQNSKNTVFHDFSIFSNNLIFFLRALSLLTLSLLSLSSLIALTTVAASGHKSEVYGNLSSKFPSAKNHHLQCDDLLHFAFLKHIFSNKLNCFKICIDLSTYIGFLPTFRVPWCHPAAPQEATRNEAPVAELGSDASARIQILFGEKRRAARPCLAMARWPVGQLGVLQSRGEIMRFDGISW